MSLHRTIHRPMKRGIARYLSVTDETHPMALDYFARVETAGGSFDLTSSHASLTESYVIGLHKTLFDGLYSNGNIGPNQGTPRQIEEIPLLCGTTWAGAMEKAVFTNGGASACTNVGFVSGDYDAQTGLKGDGASYLDTGLPLRASGNNSLGALVTELGEVTATRSWVGGGTSSGAGNFIGRFNTGTHDVYQDSNSGGGYAEIKQPRSTGYFLGISSSTSDRRLYKDSLLIASNTSDHIHSLEGTVNYHIFAGRDGLWVNADRIALANIGDGSLTTDQIEALNVVFSEFYSALNPA